MWTYRRFTLHHGSDESFDAKMAELEAEGWELVTATDTSADTFLYVRRSKFSPAPVMHHPV